MRRFWYPIKLLEGDNPLICSTIACELLHINYVASYHCRVAKLLRLEGNLRKQENHFTMKISQYTYGSHYPIHLQ